MIKAEKLEQLLEEARKMEREAPTEYHGVPVPGSLRPNWLQPEASFWRAGVLDALKAVAKIKGAA